MGGDRSGREVRDLIALIYRAPTTGVWDDVLRRMLESIGGSLIALHVHMPDTTEAATVGYYGDPGPARLHDYEAYYASRNVWLNHEPGRLQPGAVLTGQELCPEDVLLGSEFYNDFLRRIDIRHSIRGILAAPPEPLAYLSLGRPHRTRAFGASEKRVLAQLVPHVAQALTIQTAFQGIRLLRQAATETLDHVPLGVFFLDARGRVVETNAAARAILAARDTLVLERGVLAAVEPRSEVRLRRAVLVAAAGASESGAHGGTFDLAGSGERPLTAVVAPLASAPSVPFPGSAKLVVLVEPPGKRESAPLDAFTRVYRLSPAEVSLTAQLVGGMSVRQAAAALGIQENTARGQLKRVFAKTGARRQSDLVRRVLMQGPNDPQP